MIIVAGMFLAAGVGRYAHAAELARVAQTGTASAQLPHGEYTKTVTVDGRVREYRVLIPRTVDLGAASPVVLAFHGGGGNPDSIVRLSGLNISAARHRFIVVYPYRSVRFGERRLRFNAGNVGG